MMINRGGTEMQTRPNLPRDLRTDMLLTSSLQATSLRAHMKLAIDGHLVQQFTRQR